MYKKLLKRPFDFMVSLITIIVFSPVLILVSTLVRVKIGKPILFSQSRPGKDENIFKMYKFRSMKNELDSDGYLLQDEERVTKFGKFLMSSI